MGVRGPRESGGSAAVEKSEFGGATAFRKAPRIAAPKIRRVSGYYRLLPYLPAVLIILNKGGDVPWGREEPTDGNGGDTHYTMSTNDSRADGRSEADQYDELEVGNGDVVIYDVDNHNAWIQSDDAVERDSMA